MKTIEIKKCFKKEVVHYLTGKYTTIKDVVEDAVKNKISLESAFLRCTDLEEADLTGANLGHSNLGGSILIDTNFTNSVLDGVELDEYTMINQDAYNTIPDKYKHIFDVCTFID